MRTIRPFIPLIAIALIVGACAGSATQGGLSNAGAPVDGSAFSGTTGAAAGGGAPAAAPSAAPGQTGGGSLDIGAIGARTDASIIRTGSIELEVSDVPKALRAARDGIVALGGYVGASTTSNDGDHPSAEITYRIPTNQWENALDLLRGLNGLTTKVVTEHTEAVEVTGQVIDLQARIRNLEASELALQGIAARATTIDDILTVQGRLNDVRGQIEELSAQLKDLNDRAGYATLTARFSIPVVPRAEVATKGWDPSAVVDEAAARTISTAQALADAGIWFLIVWLPILIVLGLLTAISVWVIRRTGILRRPSAEGWQPPAPPPPPLPSDS
jgi:hypothetical protein